jgi:uncharacterized protein
VGGTTVATAQSARTRVFISYSHKDASVLARLKQFLAPLEHEGIINYWDDSQIAPGMLWREEIANALDKAKVAILLISADFIASKFIVENELPPLLSAAERGGTVILPVIVGPSRFSQMESLSKFQAVNNPEKPLKRLSTVQRDEILLQVANTVVNVLGTAGKNKMQDAANRGDAEAQYIVAKLKEAEAESHADSSTEKQEGVRWLREAAEAGNVGAQAELGAWYCMGAMVEKNPKEGLKWLQMAAKQGHSQAQYNLALMYAKGLGVEQNYQTTEKLLTESAQQGHMDAQYYLGEMYRQGDGVPADSVKARPWYLKAAEQGHAQAQNTLGALFHFGFGGPKDDVEAAKWLRKAAEQGDAGGQHNLALMYRNGNGVAQDDLEALKWHRKAAERGYAKSQTQIGMHFAKGWGVAADMEEAVRWFQKAAAQGEADAEFNLSVAYGQGLGGVTQDYAQALHWARLASEHGHEQAKAVLASLLK